MNKKTYTSPDMQVIKLNAITPLLTGSNELSNMNKDDETEIGLEEEVFSRQKNPDLWGQLW